MELEQPKVVSVELKYLINNKQQYPTQEIIGFQHIHKEEYVKVNLTLWDE